METRAPLIASLAIVAGMLGVSAWAWPHIPGSAQIAVHWGLNGKPDGYWHRDAALLILPVFALGLTLVFGIAPAILPYGKTLRNAPAYVVGWIGSLVVALVVHAGIVLHATGSYVEVAQSSVFVVGLLIAVLGNFLGKTRRNWFIGVRTPWSLTSDYAWEKSNRIAGRMFAITGILTVVAIMAGGLRAGAIVLGGGVIVTALISAMASYFYWRRDPERHDGGAADAR